MKKIICLFCCVLVLLNQVKAETNEKKGTLNGFIYDASNGEALIGASVFLQELKIGGTTNVSGYYVVPKIASGDYTVVFQYLGYKTKAEKIKISAGEKKSVNINLEPEKLQAEEVLIVAEAETLKVSEKLFRREISKVELSPVQIKALPQVAEADLLRSLQTLPGILPLSDFSSALYVRGGTPDQNLYLLDGTDVYNPEHAFGIFSTFNTDAIRKVELSKGGFSADYGGRLSSILDITNLDGNRKEFEGSASISLLSAKTTLQTPLGNFGSLSGSFRRTYFDQTIAKSIDEVPDYYFYDGNLKAFLDLSPRNKLTISTYGGRDFLKVIFNNNATEKTGLNYDWGNKTGSIRWTSVFTPQLFGNFWVTGSRFTSDFDLGDAVAVSERNMVTDVTLKGNLEYHHSEKIDTKFGFEEKNLSVILKQDFPDGKIDVQEKPKHYVTYFTVTYKPNILWNVESGVRYNVFKSDKTFQNVEPRFSLKYKLTDTINLKAATGIYHQYLHRIPRFFISDIWTVSNSYQKESTSYHYILGFQQEIDKDYELEIETFYKVYKNIYSFDPTFMTDIKPGSYTEDNKPVYNNTKGLFNQGKGNSVGFEMLFRKDVGAFTGWLGYSFAKTNYRFQELNSNEEFSPRHDRTSTVNFVGNLDIKNGIRALKGKTAKKHSGKWVLGTNFVYSTGQPITTPGSAYFVNSTPPGNFQNGFDLYPSEINNFRLPAYIRFDASITYEKEFKTWSIAPYLQIYNLGNRKNIWFVSYEDKSTSETIVQEVKTTPMFPLLPTIGVNFKF
ncbi:TonB-dependent receptor [bacterium]|nr:TonB-dependent receptor [bacterium]